MRVVGSWGDVCILNISSRGLQLQAARPPQRGTYVEIRRGPHVIIGCVAWAKQHRFGVKSQGVLFIDAIVAEPGNEEKQRGPVAYVPADQRSAPRPPPSAERSRAAGRAMEFACLAIVLIGGATAIYGAAEAALAVPLATVAEALAD